MESFSTLYTTILKKAYSLRNRRDFLHQCIEEMVAPKSTPKHLLQFDHPFPPPLKSYLKECRQLLSNQAANTLYEARKMGVQLRGNLPRPAADHIRLNVSTSNQDQKHRLARKLDQLCAKSEWKNVGNKNLIVNMSSRELTNIEQEALSLGLKFACGLKGKNNDIDLVTRNFRYSE